MTEDEYRATQARGQGARAILTSSEAQACLAEVEADLMRQWADSHPLRFRKRQGLYYELRGLRALKARLKQVADTADYEFRQREKRR